jgi:biotin transport system substrate-specific component
VDQHRLTEARPNGRRLLNEDKRKVSTRDIVLTALFSAIIVALGLVPPITLGFIPVPMLAGVILGSRRATFSVLLVVLLCAIGMPVLSGGRGGLAVFVSPTAGYLVGFVFAAYVTGSISEHFVRQEQSTWQQAFWFLGASFLGGIIVDHSLGVLWLGFITGMGITKALLATSVFLPGDIVKAALASFLGRVVYAGYPLLPVNHLQQM